MYINLVGDEGYIKQMAVTSVSVLENTNYPNKVVFFVFCYKFSYKPEVFIRIEKKYGCIFKCIYFVEEDVLFSNLSENTFMNKWITKATYYRLLIFKILPNYVDKIIYIDSDIVIDSNIDSLYNQFDSKYLLGAVVEVQTFKFKDSTFGYLHKIDNFKKWSTNIDNFPYIGAGFFIANISLAKKLNIFNDIKLFLEKNPETPLADQDTLNAIFGQKHQSLMLYLPPKYNVFADMDYKFICDKNYFYKKEQVVKESKRPIVIHYGGGNKPWLNRNCLNYFNVWWKYEKCIKTGLKKPTYNFKTYIHKLGKRMFPNNTKRRHILKKIFKI